MMMMVVNIVGGDPSSSQRHEMQSELQHDGGLVELILSMIFLQKMCHKTPSTCICVVLLHIAILKYYDMCHKDIIKMQFKVYSS